MWRPESVFDGTGHLDEGVVHAWLDGALAAESAREVEAHAAACAPCAAVVAEARGLIAGASRVVGALDAGALGAGALGAAAGDAPGAAHAPMVGGSQPATGGPRVVPGAGRRWRWSTQRAGLAAAAVFVFAAAGVALREWGGERAVREAVTAEQVEFVSKAMPRPSGGASSEARDAMVSPAPEALAASAPEVMTSAAPAPAPGRTRTSMPAARGRDSTPMPVPAPAAPEAPAVPEVPAPMPVSARVSAPDHAAGDERAAPRPPAVRPDAEVGAPAIAQKTAAPHAMAAAPARALAPMALSVPTVADLRGCWQLAGTDTSYSFAGGSGGSSATGTAAATDAATGASWISGVRITGGERVPVRARWLATAGAAGNAVGGVDGPEAPGAARYLLVVEEGAAARRFEVAGDVGFAAPPAAAGAAAGARGGASPERGGARLVRRPDGGCPAPGDAAP